MLENGIDTVLLDLELCPVRKQQTEQEVDDARKSYGLLLGYTNLLSSDARTIRKLILVENEKDHGQLIKYIGASYVFSEDLMDTTFFKNAAKKRFLNSLPLSDLSNVGALPWLSIDFKACITSEAV